MGDKNLVNTGSVDQATEGATVTPTEAAAEAKNEVAVVAENALAIQDMPYITQLLHKIKNEFIEVNAGIDLDFVYMGDRLVTDKKGNFVEADDDSVKYGDSIDVVVGAGEKLFSLWGAQDSPENGKLIVAEPTLEKAHEVFNAWIEENPEAADRYSIEDIDLRFVVYFVPVDSLKEGEFPNIYLMTFPKTATIAFGKYGMKLFKGKYKANGIPTGSSLNRVVTRITTKDQKSKNDPSVSYIALEFEGVGLFDPKEYGLSDEL